MRRSKIGSLTRVLLCSLGAVSAFVSMPAANAQDPAPPAETPSVSPTPAEPAAPAATPAPPTPPPPPFVAAPARPKPPEPEPAERVGSDFDVEARRFAIGYGGLSQVPVGGGVGVLTIPSVALRYWVSPTMGIDFGVGIGWRGGSIEVAGTSTDKDSVFGFIVQAGLPFALSRHRHVSFQVVPSIAVARGQTTQTTTGGAVGSDTDFSGTRIGVGARAGFELFFGFIGIPELALSATVGMQFESLNVSVESGGVSQNDSTLTFSTTVQGNPWDIFAGNVAARYYF
jgi:hypothetical protein